MALQVINSNSTQPLGGPNGGLGTDQGDTWDVAAVKLNAMFAELYAGEQTAGGTNIRPSGNISAVAGPIGSSATNTTQTLASFSLPANSLDTVGRELEVSAWGTTGATGTPGIQLNIGGATGSIATASHTSLSWEINGQCMKAGSNAQNDFFQTIIGSTVGSALNKTDTSTDGSAITISLTAVDPAAVQSSVILYGFTIEFFR